MQTPRGRLAAVLAGALCACSLLAPPALASVPHTGQATGSLGAIGGPMLGGRGLVLPGSAPALPRGLVAPSWLVADLDTGKVLGARGPHLRYAPASTLKMLTAETLIPKLNPGRLVRPTADDLAVDGSRVGLIATLRYPVRQLFTAMLVVSGNDAANTLASAAGGVAPTVLGMNLEASRLRALDTRAVNPNGLDAAGQVSSAYDLALIARAAMAQPDFRRYVATKHSSVSGPHGPISISSHDKLLYNYPGAIGIKNGYTVKAQATFVGAARRGGHTLVVVLLKTRPRYWPEAAALLDWGFAAEKAQTQPVGELVDPGGSVSAPAERRLTVASAQAAGAAPAPVGNGGSSALPAAVVTGGFLVVLAGLVRRRRSVVRRRRSAAR